MLDAIPPEFFVQVNYYFGIDAGREVVTLALQVGSELPVIVNFAVTGQEDLSGFVGKGLSTGGRVYDG